MEKNTVKGLFIFTLFVMGIVVASEGGRDVPVPVPVQEEFYNPQHFFGGWPFGFGLGPFGFPFKGGFGHFPWLAAVPKDDAGLTDLPKRDDNSQVRSP